MNKKEEIQEKFDRIENGEVRKLFSKNNKVYVTGEICDEFEFQNRNSEKKYYRSMIKIKRKSGVYDCIPIVVSDKLLMYIKKLGLTNVNQKVEIYGEMRSYSKLSKDGKKHIDIFIYVTYIDKINYENDYDQNMVYFEGILSKEPNYRVTPTGILISDVSLIIKRMYNASDWIAGILWGSQAIKSKQLKESDKIKTYGRIQSREYVKNLEDGTKEKRVAYEVSVWKIEI